MSNVSKKLFLASKYLAILFFASVMSAPVVTLGEEPSATTTPASIPVVNDATIATTTSPTATTTASIATSTDKFLSPVSEPEAATTTREDLGESATSDTADYPIEEPSQPIVIIDTPPQPQLSMREFKKRVVQDSHAFHSCEAETFRIDITHKTSATARIMLQRDSDVPYEVEIGSLPLGIDVVFSKNGAYQYMQGANDRFLELAITNQLGSQKGDFSIPVIYTKKDTKDSSVICQINIVNQ
jgi:hypothetical protein